ncbi:hypothetical protein EV714DRAFT_277778 [Schizophyllum commune]
MFTLCNAYCRYDSFFDFKIDFEPCDKTTSGYFDQVIKFPEPRPIICLDLKVDFDSTGNEVYVACIAAKAPLGEPSPSLAASIDRQAPISENG